MLSVCGGTSISKATLAFQATRRRAMPSAKDFSQLAALQRVIMTLEASQSMASTMAVAAFGDASDLFFVSPDVCTRGVSHYS